MNQLPLGSPAEIREHLEKVAFGNSRVDGDVFKFSSPSLATALAHQVTRMSAIKGWSSEETMTVLAYHALLMYEQLSDRAFQQALINVNQTIVPT